MAMVVSRNRLVEEANRRLALPVPGFALADRGEIIEELLRQPEIVDYIATAEASSSANAPELRSRARQYAEEIGPKFSAFFYFRLGRFLARTLIRLHYRVRAVAVDDALMAEAPTDATVILVSNHRSNFDPLVITYLASRRSTIALSAGEWARLWPLHHFVRAAGGFVVDRDAEDALYRVVLATYVRLSASRGLHQAFFPEGELTRSGRMGPFKLGFLNYYCRACGPERDVIFVPIGINYDRIPEDRRLARAEGGFSSPGTSFLIGSTLRYVGSVLALPFRRRSRRFGNACVAFGAPVSLHQWLKRRDIDLGEIKSPGRLPWLPELAQSLERRCAAQIPASPVALTAHVFTEEPECESRAEADIAKRLRTLERELEERGANVCETGGSDDSLRAAMTLLEAGGLIRSQDGGRWGVVESERPVLSHYARSIAHLVP